MFLEDFFSSVAAGVVLRFLKFKEKREFKKKQRKIRKQKIKEEKLNKIKIK